jgi:hypothetical protein
MEHCNDCIVAAKRCDIPDNLRSVAGSSACHFIVRIRDRRDLPTSARASDPLVSGRRKVSAHFANIGIKPSGRGAEIHRHSAFRSHKYLPRPDIARSPREIIGSDAFVEQAEFLRHVADFLSPRPRVNLLDWPGPNHYLAARGRIKPISKSMIVVLPAPDGPLRTVNPRDANSMFTAQDNCPVMRS